MSQDVENFLNGRSGVSAQFPTVGHSYEGIVEDFEMEQQRDYDDSNVLLWWDEDETKPKMQLVITLKTNARGKFTKAGQPIDVDGDTGIRNVYVKGAQMQKALGKALRTTGVRAPEIGGRLKVTYVGNGKASNPKYFDPKLYEFEYTKASEARAEEFLSEPDKNTSDPFA